MSMMLAAVEPSGDRLGAALFEELKKTSPNMEIFGCGGDEMQSVGFESMFPTDDFAIMGFTDVVKALPKGFQRANQLAEAVAARNAQAAVLIDGWAFSRITAKRLREKSPTTKIFKLAAPQLWASRPQRIDFVKKYFDGVLTLLPFEPEIFQEQDIPAAFVGNPTFQNAWKNRGDRSALRDRLGVTDEPVLCLLPGSRKSEVEHLLPVFKETVELLKQSLPTLKIILPIVLQVETLVRQLIQDWDVPITFVSSENKYEAFAAADVALAASGTVSTELAINETPMVIAYKVDWLTGIWAKRIVISKYASILNVLANREVIPEFIQENCLPEPMARELISLLQDGAKANRQREAFAKLLPQLHLESAPSGKRAAAQILDWLKS